MDSTVGREGQWVEIGGLWVLRNGVFSWVVEVGSLVLGSMSDSFKGQVRLGGREAVLVLVDVDVVDFSGGVLGFELELDGSDAESLSLSEALL